MHKAFVIIPYKKRFEPIFEKIIKKALEENGFIVERAKDLQNQQNILKDIIYGILNADLVIADLTESNSNVFYELGIAHTMQRPTIMITQSIKKLPFDLKTYRAIPYSTEFDQVNILYQTLKEISAKIINGEAKYSNPVRDFLEKEDLKELELVFNESREQEIVENKEVEKGILDFITDGIESIENIGETTTKLTNFISKHTKELNKLAIAKESAEKSSDYKRLKAIFLSASILIKKLSENIRNEMPDYQIYWSGFNDNVNSLIDVSEVVDKKERIVIIKFLDKLRDFKEATQFALTSTLKYMESVKKTHGISKSLNEAGRDIISTLNLLNSNLEIGIEFCEKIIEKIINKFNIK